MPGKTEFNMNQQEKEPESYTNHVTSSSCTMLQKCLPQQEAARRNVHIMEFRFNMLQILWKLQVLTPQCCK